MNKNDLIAAVSETADLSKADATKAVDAIFETISGSLSSGNEVRLVGFGTFSVAHRKESKGRNPRTGEKVSVEEKSLPFFKPGRKMHDKLNGKGS